MSSFMNKMKDALQGDKTREGQTSDSTNAGRFDSELGQDGSRKGYNTTGSAAGAYDDTSSSHTTAHLPSDSHRHGQQSSGLPGSFPDSTTGEHDTGYSGSNSGYGTTGYGNTSSSNTGYGNTQHDLTSRHKDGREYVSPRGTAVGTTGTEHHSGNNLQTGTGQSDYDRSEQAMTGRDQSGQTGYGQSGVTTNYDGPTHATGSVGNNTRDNDLMDPASKARGSNVMETGASGIGSQGKYGSTEEPYESSSTGTGSHHQHHHHNKLHKKDDPRGYESGNSQTQGRDYDNSRSGTGATTGAAAAAGTGALAHEVIPEKHHHRHQEPLKYSNEPFQKSAGQGVGGLGSGAGHQSGYDSRDNNTHTGSGLNDAKVYNTVIGAGSAQEGHHKDHHKDHHKEHHHDRRGQSGYESMPSQPGTGDFQDSTQQRNTTESQATSALHDHRNPLRDSTTSGGGISSSRNNVPYDSNANNGSSDPYSSNTSRAAGQGRIPGSDTTSNPTRGGSAYPSGAGSHLSSANSQSGSGLGGVSGTGSGQGLSGHKGHRVVHECQHCGRDNDISHHFGPNATFRISQ